MQIGDPVPPPSPLQWRQHGGSTFRYNMGGDGRRWEDVGGGRRMCDKVEGGVTRLDKVDGGETKW